MSKYKITKPTVVYEIPYDEFLSFYNEHRSNYAALLSQKYDVSRSRIIKIKDLYAENLMAMGAENPFVPLKDTTTVNIFIHQKLRNIITDYCKKNNISVSVLVSKSLEYFNRNFYELSCRYRTSPSPFRDTKSNRTKLIFKVYKTLLEETNQHISDYRNKFPLLDITLSDYVGVAIASFINSSKPKRISHNSILSLGSPINEVTIKRMFYLKENSVSILSSITRNSFISIDLLIDTALSDYLKDVVPKSEESTRKFTSNVKSVKKINVRLSEKTFAKLKTFSQDSQKCYGDILDDALNSFVKNLNEKGDADE